MTARLPVCAAITLLLVGLLHIGPVCVLADEVHLKNGSTMTATIKRQDDRSITFDIPGVGLLTLQRNEIDFIKPSAEAPAEPAKAEPAASAAAADGNQWVVFTNPGRAVHLSYPKTWYVVETLEQYPYLVTIAPQKPDPHLKAMSATTIELFKYYHVSLTTPFGQGAAPEVLDRYVTQVLPSLSQNVQVVGTQDLTVQGVPAKLVEIKAMDPRGSIALQMYVLAAVKDDVLATLFCQSPQDEFEKNRAMCGQVARRVQPFSTHSAWPDNAMLDTASGQLSNEAIAALKVGDGKSMVAKFEKAIHMNPADADAHLTYGNVLMLLAKEQSGEDRLELLQRSEHELQVAAQFFESGAQATKAAPKLSEAYFVLGEIAYYGREDPVRAKALYEQALKYGEHAGARDALKRYENK